MIAVLGALTITAEYSTQAIRTSLTVMPRRGILYGAKAVVFAAVAMAVAFPASFLAWFVGQRLLASTHAEATLGQPNVLRAVLASAIFVVLCGLFSYGLGAVLRSTAGTITAAYGFLFLLPQLARALPTTWYNDAIRWLPGGQFDGAISTSGPPDQPAPVLHLGRAGGLRRLHGSSADRRSRAAAPQGRLTHDAAARAEDHLPRQHVP